jgi:hypothetical protein
MTLNEIRNLVLAAIDKSDLTITAEKINDQNHGSECIKQVLNLLRSGNGITFTPLAATLDPPTRLVIEGRTSIFDRGNLAAKIILVDASSRPRACQIEVDNFGLCAPKDLADKNLFTILESVRAFEVFESRFADVKLRASSDVEVTAMSITGKGTTATDVVISNAPKVKLEELGFVLDNFLFQRMNRPEARFSVTGNFMLNAGGKEVKVAGEVEIPVASSSIPGRWRVKFEAVGDPLTVAPNDVAGWAGATGAFDSFPAEILPLSDFGLKGFTLSLDGRSGNVTAVEFVISTSKVWTFTQGFQLSNIAVVTEVVPPFESPIISLYGKARFTVGTLSLDCVIGFPSGSGRCVLSFSTPSPFKLSELAGLPGGAALNRLGLPPTEKPIEVSLADLTFDIDLKAPEKLKAIRLNARTDNFEWRLIPDLLSISNPQLYLDLTGPVRAWQVNAIFNGTLDLYLFERPEQKVLVNFSMSRIEGRWALAANTVKKISLFDAAGKLGIETRFPEQLRSLELSGLSARYVTGGGNQPPEFSFSAAIAITNLKLGGIELSNTSLSVSYHRAEDVSMSLRAALTVESLNNAEMALVFAYSRGWKVMIEALGLRLEYDVVRGTAHLDLGSKTIGEIIQTVYRLVRLDARAQLPEPWNAMEGISLRGARFTINFGNGSVEIAQILDPEVDLGFFRLKEINVSYRSGAGGNLMVKGRLLGAGQDSVFNCDPMKPGANLPPQPSAAKFLELQLLALGQRLYLKPIEKAPEIRRVSDAITLMREAFKNSNPNGHPLATTGSTLAFDARNGLLVGAEFTLLGALSMAIVFNDGVIAGVSVGLDRKRVRFFRGLEFEILYKKISESIGVYQIDLQLPDAIRQIELGQVSITAPALWLEVYTNGNFRVDLGFPKNNDFSRSFQLQVFPFLGGGGFYFAKLEGATAQRLPRDVDIALPVETFKPVLAFGLGLRIGIGKSINRGIFAAELSLCYEGIIEGTLAFFNGESVKRPDSVYYWMQGTLGIVGRILGVVRFAVITAEVSLVVAARVSVTLESFQPLVLTFSASVKVDLVVKIGAGWLSVDVHCGFFMELREEFTIPVRNPGIPAWAPARPAVGPGAPAQPAVGLEAMPLYEEAVFTAASLIEAAVEPRPFQPLPLMAWDPIGIPDFERGELRLLFRPQFTVATIENAAGNKEQFAYCVALLFLKTAGVGGHRPDPTNLKEPTDFDRMAQAMLLWAIHSHPDTPNVITSINDLLVSNVSAEILQGIYRVLTLRERGAAPFTGLQVAEFLCQFFEVVIEAQKRPKWGIDAPPSYYDKGRPTVAIFPMIPDLRVEAVLTVERDENPNPAQYELLHYSAKFDEQTVVPLTYHDEILKYFEKLVSEFRTDIEREADTAGADTPPLELDPPVGRSIAEFVFEDYFLLIMRDVIQAGLDLMKNKNVNEIEVGRLVETLFSKNRFQNLSGMVSRFMLPGARLPKPRYLLEDVRGLWQGNEPAPLYALTGQQFALPKFNQPPAGSRYIQCSIDLIPPETGAFDCQYVMAGYDNPEGKVEDEDVKKLSVTLVEGTEPIGRELSWVDELRKAYLQPAALSPFGKLRMSRTEPRRFALANRVKFIPRQTLEYSLGARTVPPGEPTIWTLTEGLRRAISEPRPTLPAFSLDLGVQRSEGEKMEFHEAGAYDWATALTVTIRRPAPPDEEEESAPPPLAYEIEGVDAEGVLLLEKILRHAAGNESLIESAHVLYQTREADGTLTLTSDNPVDVSAFILSTLADAPITISIAPNLFETHPLEMLRLLWRSNLLRSGGYYLYYRIQAGETVAGLPDEIFENEVGKITILIRFAFRAKEVPPFVNRAVVGETTATGDKLFATSLKKLASIRLRSTTRIAEILEQYRVSFYDLAKAIGEVTLQQGIRLEFEGWSHQVARGETWDKIGKRYSMSGQAVREANGNPTDEPAAYSVITIPKISFLTEEGETLRSIANTFKNHGISPLAELVWQNAQRVAFAIPGAETLEILVWEQLSVRLPMQPPGHAGFVVRRRMPVVNDQVTPSPEEQLNYLYSILGCRVIDNPKFNGSVEAPSDGPKVLSDEPVESLPRTPPDPACQYTKVIPCFKFSKAPRVQAPPLIDPERNPYRGVGETLTVRFDWLDGFGNKTFSPFNPPPDPPPNKQKGNDIFLLRLGYTDELIGVERWPAVSVGYSVRPDEQDSAKIYVYVNLDFDVSRYAPHDGGERSEADAKRTAKADLETFRRIFYQLTWGTTRVLIHTTLDNQSGILESGLPGVPPEQSAQRALIGFVVSIINYLAAVIDPKHVFHYTDFRPTEADPERYLVDIATELHVPLDALQRLNPGLPPRLTTDTIILIPELPFPAGVRLSRRVSLSNPAELFPLAVNLTLERLGRVDDGFLDAQDVAGNPAEEDGFLDQPSVKFATSLLDPLSIAGGNSGSLESGAIRMFAREFEQLFPNIRLATGLARAEDIASNSRNRFWVVRTGSQSGAKWISCAIQSHQQHFFAPVPLATTLLSDKELAVYDYGEDDTGGVKRYKLKEVTASYGGVDLDEYARRFVSAIDTVLQPKYATPAYILERQRAGARFSAILKAKLTIANEIAKSVDRIAALNENEEDVDQIAENDIGDLAQAQELLRQRMLVHLSAAYDVDTIVQIGVTVDSPYKLLEDEQPGDDSSKVFESFVDMPKFFGQPVAKLPDGSTEEVDFTLSTAKIPLGPRQSYLTFLFDSKKATPEQTLDVQLSYEAASLEREISEVPGLPASASSSWLTFINPVEIAEDVTVKIPIPIRAYPIPPTLGNQSVAPAPNPDLKIEKTRQYSYRYDYRRLGPGNDLVYTAPKFNAMLSEVSPENPENGMDLFQALVSFDRVWDQVNRDLSMLPELFDPEGADVDRDRVLDALAAFAEIATMVANSWGDWPAVRDEKYLGEEPEADPFLYVISEGVSGQQGGPLVVIVRKCKDADPNGDTPIPSIEIEGWEQVEIETENPNERCFQYRNDEVFLKEDEAKRISIRRVVFDELDILHKQDAWAGVRMTRNENLFGDRACTERSPRTNPKFIYQTPMVRFPEILTPLLECDKKIDIARIPSAPDGTPDEDRKKPLEGHLARLFERFFESVAENLDEEETEGRRIQLTCRYQYDLDHPPYDLGGDGDANSLPITLPIVMAPPFDFIVPTDLRSCGENLFSFLCSLSGAIKGWFEGRYPSTNNGRFTFDISVYSTLGAAGRLPIYRMKNLQLMLDDVSDLKEGA